MRLFSRIRQLVAIGALALAVVTTGCIVRTGVYATATPSLVAVGPGVWVMSDYAYPVFYSNGYYWSYNSGYWYQSSYMNGGWVMVGMNVVPVGIRTLPYPPTRYVRYRPAGSVQVRPVPRGHYHGAPGAPVYRGRGAVRPAPQRGGATVRTAPGRSGGATVRPGPGVGHGGGGAVRPAPGGGQGRGGGGGRGRR